MIDALNMRLRGSAPMYDQGLLWTTLILLGIGFVMVYSSSIAIAEADKMTGYRSTFYMTRQGVYLLLSIALGVITFQFPMQFWQRMAPVMFLIAMISLIVVLIPGVGIVAGGSRRWISLGFMSAQPSEFMKLFATAYVSDYTLRKASHMDSFTKGFMPMLVVMLVVGGLLLMEPDFGAFAVVAAIAMSILWLGGINIRIFIGLFTLLVIGFIALIYSSPYRLERVIGFMDPWSDPYGKGYQLSHALIAFGRGEWFGVGLGASVEKLLYLPEAHTDFLLSVIAEELGFAGVAAVILLFVWVVMRAFAIGRECIDNERYFSSLLAQGFGVWFGVQGIINMGVNMGLLPTKGLTLPFLSYGGSGILANCMAMAMLLRIDYENRRLQKGLPA